MILATITCQLFHAGAVMNRAVHCKCGHVYELSSDAAGAKCPQCGAAVSTPRKLKVAESLEVVAPSLRAPKAPSAPRAPAGKSPIVVASPATSVRQVRGRTAPKLPVVPLIAACVVGVGVLVGGAVIAYLSLGRGEQQTPTVASSNDLNTARPVPPREKRPVIRPPDHEENLPLVEEPPLTPDANPEREPEPEPPVAALELGEAIPLYFIYSIRPPQSYTAMSVRSTGTTGRWRLDYVWKCENPRGEFRVVIERDPEYALGQHPRVSNRVLPAGEVNGPITYRDGIYIVPGATIDTVEIAGRSFVRAVSGADQHLAANNAVLAAGYDRDRLLRVEGWYEGDYDPARTEQFKAAANSLTVADDMALIPTPDNLQPDESLLAASFPTTEFVKVEAVAGDSPTEIKPHITAVAVSNGGKFVAFGTSEGFLSVHRTESKEELMRLRIAQDEINVVQFMGEQQLFTVAVGLRIAVRTDLATMKSFHAIFARNHAFSSDGKRVVLAEGPLVAVGPMEGQAEFILAGDKPDVIALATVGDGLRVAYGTVAGAFTVWDAGKSVVIQHKDMHPGGTTHLALAGDGQRLTSAGRDKQWIVWDVANDKAIHQKADFGRIDALRFTAGGQAAMFRDGNLEIWNVDDATLARKFDLKLSGGPVAIAYDGSFGVSCAKDGDGIDDLQVTALGD